jgi:nicotinamidase-related amidase
MVESPPVRRVQTLDGQTIAFSIVGAGPALAMLFPYHGFVEDLDAVLGAVGVEKACLCAMGPASHALLSARGVETLLFAGGTTTVCVESTLRDAMFLDYNCVLLADCTADLDDGLHASAVARIDMFFGWVSSSTELTAALAERAPTRAAR